MTVMRDWAMMNRRDMLFSVAAALAWMTPGKNLAGGWIAGRGKAGKIPLIHITDLYHPPQDPDDHIDLATVAALGEYDLRGVMLDNTRKFLMEAPPGFDIRRDPGFTPVAQLSRMLGRPIPVAAGPSLPLSRPDDDVADRAPGEQAGVKLLLQLLEDSGEKVVVSAVGSTRVLTAACNRNPDLVRSKVRYVLLNAGSLAGPKREWNVDLDAEAYVGLWRSGLPIRWYPCATERGAFHPDHERGTYWKTTHAEIFRALSPELRGWFTHALSPGNANGVSDNPGDADLPRAWEQILQGERNMWSTASLVMGVGRVLAKTAQGWRFVDAASAGVDRVWGWRLDGITATVNARAEVGWRLANEGGNALLFGRERGPEYAGAMSEALGALLGSLRAS